MEHKETSKKSYKTLILIIAVVIIIFAVLGIVILLNRNNNNSSVEERDSNKVISQSEVSDISLQGIYIYESDENTKYKFDNDGKGALILTDAEYIYKYSIENDKLMIDFEDESFYDCTYNYSIENDTLKLIGEEGTTGGEYILKKESK